MDLRLFEVSSTNIFPIANSALGGQLCTEYNLRTRESICTDPSVRYMIGPSYTHSDRDFKLSSITDGSNVVINSAGFRISEGRALVNGHFIESLRPLTIDMQEQNIIAQRSGEPALEGRLAVGLRVWYSTETTMIGSMMPESDSVYRGVTVVILPLAQFKLPTDEPADQSKITAHLKLGEIEYRDGRVLSIVGNDNKVQAFPAQRIQNVDSLLSSSYVRKTGLDAKKIYVFSGKGTDPSTGLDTWCNAVDSLIVWDENPNLRSGAMPANLPREAEFSADIYGTYLSLPHKQPDGPISSTDGTLQYYAPRMLQIPNAAYDKMTSGVVSATYTKNIRNLQSQINRIYKGIQGGHLLQYIPVLTSREKGVDNSSLPVLNANCSPGDYVLVGQDLTLETSPDTVTAPATMYIVIPGNVSNIAYVDASHVPSGGVVLATINWSDIEDAAGQFPSDPAAATSALLEYSGVTTYRGVKNKDYFVVTVGSSTYRYKVTANATQVSFSDPVQVSAAVPFATQETIGGFLDAPDDGLGMGYVKIDSEGHLYLVDYDILSSGVLAYRLGEDYATSKGVDASTIQQSLDDFVNERVAFPSAAQIEASKQTNSDPNIITVTIDLSDSSTSEVINIYGIDSRFNTSVYIRFTGHSTQNLTINIADCEKIRLDIPSTIGDATFNVYRCGVYYDAAILNRVNLISGLSLWYERYSSADPRLSVIGNKVTLLDRPQSNSLEYWTSGQPNDHHIVHGLRSITFAPDGHIIGCEIGVANNTTGNVAEGVAVSVFQYTLPQGTLQYPEKRLTSPVKVCGQFISAYPSVPQYIMIETSFTALSQSVNSNSVTSGMISIKEDVKYLDSIAGVPMTSYIDSWQPGTFNTFSGGTSNELST